MVVVLGWAMGGGLCCSLWFAGFLLSACYWVVVMVDLGCSKGLCQEIFSRRLW